MPGWTSDGTTLAFWLPSRCRYRRLPGKKIIGQGLRPEQRPSKCLCKRCFCSPFGAMKAKRIRPGMGFAVAQYHHLTSGSGWNNACEESEVEFSLSEDNSSIDPVVGYTGHADPWRDNGADECFDFYLSHS
jgi:hypothetical protein